ncbi:MAG TPA: hypothetical protein PK867_14075, partial [Pirellulales bacterium]|nr:hypothetical protein [Pirellulales bacterium]
LRKQTLVEQIMIDPQTFAITLYGSDGQALAKQRLSEGEEQIFAISVLWGLARPSARSLPAIIDTPMARLDQRHREHLVERYFPNASHQVIILSTDTEVDRRYYCIWRWSRSGASGTGMAATTKRSPDSFGCTCTAASATWPRPAPSAR